MSIARIRDIVGGRRLFSIPPGTSLRVAAQMMADNKVGAVAVIEGDRLVGILSERDIVFRAVAQGLSADDTTVAEIMTRDPVTVDINDAISDALAAKTGDAFRHVPVTENGTVVGVLSYRDIPAEYVMLFERFREMSSARPGDGA